MYIYIYIYIYIYAGSASCHGTRSPLPLARTRAHGREDLEPKDVPGRDNDFVSLVYVLYVVCV